MKILKRILKILAAIFGLFIFVFVVLLIIPETETVKPIKPRQGTQYWQMSHGYLIAYTKLSAADSSQKPAIIYLHGGPGGYIHSSTLNIMQELTLVGYDVFLYDQLGSGLSDRTEKFSDISFYKHRRDLHEIITQHIKREKVILIGHSFGAILATHFCAAYPELVEKIVLSSPGVLQPYASDSTGIIDLDLRYPVPDSLDYIEVYDFRSDVDQTILRPKALVATTGAFFFNKKLISDAQMDRILNTLASKFTRGMVCDEKNVQPEEGGGGLYAFLATNQYADVEDVRQILISLDTPALVIHGQCDYIPYSAAYEYVDLFQNGRFVFVENAGHIILWEKPEIYIKTISAFLEE